jgi:hypothetical protein
MQTRQVDRRDREAGAGQATTARGEPPHEVRDFGRAQAAQRQARAHHQAAALVVGKPATRKKLAQTIANYFRHHGGQLADDAVELIIDDLIRLKYVSQVGTKVSYHLA